MLPAILSFLVGLACISPGRAQIGGGTWETLAPMPSKRQELATAVFNGNIYVMGGYDENGLSTARVEVYNPNTNSWTSASPLPYPVNHNSAAFAADHLYSFSSSGGFVYDLAGDAWTPIAPMNSSHGLTPAVGVLNDKIYLAGGTRNEISIPDMEMYDPATDTWTMLAPMGAARNHTAGAVIDGKFYVVGGRVELTSLDVLEVYDPKTDSWTTRAPMPTARSGIAAASVNGELWVFGGELPTLHGEVEAYNPLSNTWRELPHMPTPRHGIWASVIGNRIYLPGGATAQNYHPSNTNDVFIVDRKATLANISSRLKVQTGDNVLIGGFIITGDISKRVLLRAPGPSLGLSGSLADPVLELYDNASQLVATNDDWTNAPNKQEIIDSTLAPTRDLESAILTRLAPGGYTVIVRGANESSGIGLVEVYDLEAGSDSKLANISTRGFVQTGDNVLIGGVILTGNEPISVILRAIGPSLTVPGALANPNLELHDENGAVLAANDNWRSAQEAEIIATQLAPSKDLESAIVRTLAPGSYTAIVRGVNGGTGVALVEAYALE